jgi:hypothetical protein
MLTSGMLPNADNTACVHAGITQATVKCVNITGVDCDTLAPSGLWAFDGSKDILNDITDPDAKNDACCVSEDSAVRNINFLCRISTSWGLCYSSDTRSYLWLTKSKCFLQGCILACMYARHRSLPWPCTTRHSYQLATYTVYYTLHMMRSALHQVNIS